MTDGTPTNEETEKPAGVSRRNRILRRVGLVIVVLLALFYGAGGWYFSSLLGSDAFAVDEEDEGPELDLEVVGVGDEEITFRAEEGGDTDLIADGVYGAELVNGWLEVGEIVEARTEGESDVVTRRLLATDGEAPAVGSMVDFQSYYYEANPLDVGFQYEDVRYTSPLGEFDAWFVPAEDETWVIAIHGKGAEPRECLRILKPIAESGHPTLIITYRNDLGQPADPSGYHRYGATEWADVEGAVQYAIDQGAEDVVLVGLSTGAAHSLGFLYESDLEQRVVGAIFDSPNIDFGRTVDYEASQRSLPLIGLGVPQSLATVAKFIGSLRFDFDWAQVDFIDDADRIDVPVLVFHGTDDGTVPLDVSQRLQEQRPDLVTLVVVEGAEHVQSWNRDPSAYEDRVLEFLAEVG